MSGKVSEKTLWGWLKKCRSPLVHIERIENLLKKGTPDVDGWVTDGAELRTGFQIEQKTCERPKRKTTTLNVVFQDGQVEYIEKRVDVGGLVYVLLQVGVGHQACRYLIPGNFARALENRRYTESALQRLLGQNGRITPQGVLDQIMEDIDQGFLRIKD